MSKTYLVWRNNLLSTRLETTKSLFQVCLEISSWERYFHLVIKRSTVTLGKCLLGIVPIYLFAYLYFFVNNCALCHHYHCQKRKKESQDYFYRLCRRRDAWHRITIHKHTPPTLTYKHKLPCWDTSVCTQIVECCNFLLRLSSNG